jgi:hypothetical protein
VAEVWFDEKANGVQADIVRRFQHSTSIAEAQCAPFHTILLDLGQDADSLFAKMKRETRYEVRRATDKDGLKHEMWVTADAGPLAQFLSFYDECVAQKGLPRLRNARLRRLAESGALSLSLVREETGAPLVWHAYYRSTERVRLLHSASLARQTGAAYRSLLGRANRYHHWHDIVTFRSQGTRLYDFGGWYAGDSDPKRLSINQFKEGFGGQVVLNYNCVQGLTRIGKAAVWLYARVARVA